MPDTTVIVIGAGPAGLCAARELALADVDFMLFSRETVPGESKACGGYVAARAFREVGIEPISNAYPVSAIRMKFPGLDPIMVDFNEPPGYNIARDVLGSYLLSLIPRSSGQVRMNTEVCSLEVGRHGCKVHIRKDGKGDSVTCEMVIDCSGVNSVSARSGVIREHLPPDRVGYAVQYHLQVESPRPTVNDFFYGSEFSPHGYAWVFPRGSIVVVGTGGLVSEVRSSSRRVTEYLDHLIYETEPASSELKSARIVKREAALMPLAGVVAPSYGDRILLAGDAAAHCSPITGEGIYYSMVAGMIAGQTAAESAQAGRFSSRGLRSYEKRWRKKLGSDLKWGLWLQKRLIRGGSSSLGGRVLNSRRNVRVMAEMLMGVRSVRSAIVAVAPSYIRSKIGITSNAG